MNNSKRRHPRPYSTRLNRTSEDIPFNRGTVFGTVSVVVCSIMTYPVLFVLLEDWIGYPFIYNYVVAIPVAVVFWFLAKKRKAPKGLLILPIVVSAWYVLMALAKTFSLTT